MQHLSAEQWSTFRIAYLDDIIIFAVDCQDYLRLIALVFDLRVSVGPLFPTSVTSSAPMETRLNLDTSRLSR